MMRRRQFIAAAGTIGVTTVAGCSGGSPPEEPEFDQRYFGGVDNFNGFVDMTDQDTVVALVGAGEEGFMFEHYRESEVPESDEPPYDSAAVSITPNTTVRWEWTGKGGGHNVQEENENWKNDDGVVNSEGHTWSREFSNAGTHLYFCWPHEGLGMKGGIFVDATGE